MSIESDRIELQKLNSVEFDEQDREGRGENNMCMARI